MTYLLRVFIDEIGNCGDAASIVIDEGRHIADVKRQEMARELNTGETIFINDLAAADISVMHPHGEIGFAGVGVVGTAWLLAKLRGKPTERMHSRDGEITTWQDGDITWARGPLSIMPPWNYKQLDDAKAVEQIKLEETKDWQHTMAWAWIDKAKGLIRARTFAADWDIPEAQGNGSGAMVLAAKLDRTIEIHHGEGSVIFAKPAPNNCADIGGRVSEVDIRPSLPSALKGLVLLIGPPAAGKSTFAKKLLAKYELEQEAYISNDAIAKEMFGVTTDRGDKDGEIFAEQDRRIAERLKRSAVVIVDATNVRPEARKRLITIAAEYKQPVTAFCFRRNIETLLSQNRMRDVQVPEEMVREYAGLMNQVTEDTLHAEDISNVYEVPNTI